MPLGKKDIIKLRRSLEKKTSNQKLIFQISFTLAIYGVKIGFFGRDACFIRSLGDSTINPFQGLDE
jgi:hypothetical protein